MRNIMRIYTKRAALSSVFAMLLLSGCSSLNGKMTEAKKAYDENFEITGAEKKQKIGEVNEAVFFQTDRSNQAATEMEVSLFEEGRRLNLQEGRYQITGYPVGNVYIYDGDDRLLAKEIIGTSFYGNEGITVDIDETYTVFVDGGYEAVQIMPAPTALSHVLPTGIHHVGTDIEAGSYTFGTEEYGIGYLFVYEKDEEAKLFEVIGNPYGASDSRVDLKEGQAVYVSGLSFVLFEPLKDGM